VSRGGSGTLDVTSFLSFLGGLICAGLGGELFVRGTVGLARAARISPGIVAATVAAFATSSPEVTIAVSSALDGVPQISLGDALGSNLVNVALILGLALVMAPVRAEGGSLKRDLPVALLVQVVLLVLLFDGRLSRIDAGLLLAVFLAWLFAVVHEARSQRSAATEVLGEPRPSRAFLESGAGLALLIAAGKLIVLGATGIATAFGLSEFVIGATIVAIGTSVPEMATVLISRWKGHDEVGLGTVLGSNIFNGLLVVGIAAAIAPYEVGFREVATALVIGLAAVALIYPPRSGIIDRWRGGSLLALYAVYVLAVLQA
jgi:cation:H+ antiporter